MKPVFTLLVLCSTAISISAQSYTSTKRLWESVIGNIVVTNDRGQVFVEIQSTPDSPSVPTYLEVSQLPWETVFHSVEDMYQNGPYVGYDVNGNGHADILEHYGAWQVRVTLDVFSEQQRSITLAVPPLAYQQASRTRAMDVDRDGMDDIVHWEDDEVLILWGDADEPLTQRTTLGLGCADRECAILNAGSLGDRFVVAAASPHITTRQPILRAITVDDSTLQARPYNLVLSFGRSVEYTPVSGVVFSNDSLWHIVDVSSRLSWRISLDTMEQIICDPTLSVIDGRRPIKNSEVLGQKWQRQASGTLADLDQQLLVYRFEHTGGPVAQQIQYIATDFYAITDPMTLALRFDGSVFHLPGRYNTITYDRARHLPDVDGDGIPEIVTGYQSGLWQRVSLVDFYLSSYAIQASADEEQTADEEYSVRPTPSGWVVTGDLVGNSDRVQLVDLLGRTVPITVTRSASQLSIEAGSATSGPLWLVVGARAFPVLR